MELPKNYCPPIKYNPSDYSYSNDRKDQKEFARTVLWWSRNKIEYARWIHFLNKSKALGIKITSAGWVNRFPESKKSEQYILYHLWELGLNIRSDAHDPLAIFNKGGATIWQHSYRNKEKFPLIMGVEFTWYPYHRSIDKARDIVYELQDYLKPFYHSERLERCYLDDGMIEIPSPLFHDKRGAIYFYQTCDIIAKACGLKLKSPVGGGGMHINIAVPKFAKRAQKLLWIKWIISIVAENPWIAWIFNEPEEEGNANQLVLNNRIWHNWNNKTLKNLLKDTGYKKWALRYDITRIEWRCFDMVHNETEFEACLDFVNDVSIYCWNKALAGEQPALTFLYEERETWLKERYRKCKSESKAFMKEVGIDATRYKVFWKRNFEGRKLYGIDAFIKYK